MRCRHVALRTCVACRTTRPKSELVRVVRTPRGGIEVDISGRAAGRGAYVCRRVECAEAGVRKHGLQRALGQPLSQQTVREMLEAAAGPGTRAAPEP